MHTSRLGLAWVAGFALLAAACSSTESRCEDMCQWLDDCGSDPSSDCKSSCESDYDDLSNDCQEAFDEFTDCIADEDLQCSAVSKNCDGEATKFIVECAGELD